jgi:outer membrane lipoprotein-sorting protein
MTGVGLRSAAASVVAVICLLPANRGVASEDVLARSRATYAALKSYSDTGTVVYEYATASVSRHTFKTYYRAPRQFLFEFTEDKADGGSRLAIWCEGADFQSWDSDTGIHNSFPRGKGNLPFVTSTFPTVGASTQIPSLLFPGAGLISTLAELGEMTAAGTETINGRPAHKLTGVARSTYGTGHEHNIRRTTVWIDTETLLIRRIFEDTPKGVPAGSRSRRTTTFEALSNPTLDDGRFKFAVPSLQK